MKSEFILIIICLFSKFSSFCQENIKMSKSELKEYVIILSSKIDSLNLEQKRLKESFDITNTNLKILEQKNKISEVEINRQNNVISQIEIEKNHKISEKDSLINKLNIEIAKINSTKDLEINKLNQEITKLNQEITNVQNNSVVSKTTSNQNDFLNNYYFNQTPLTNASFSFELSKVIFDETRNYDSYNYDSEGKGSIRSLPELLDFISLTFWSVTPNNNLPKEFVFKNYMVKKTSDYLNSKLPKIEILKNKLFTLKYSDGTEESFLFNVTQNEINENDKKFKLANNQRKILQIELANEEVKRDGTNNEARDIVWRIYAIESDCYLALTSEQLKRLKLKLFDFNDGIEVINKEGKILLSGRDYVYGNINTTGEGIYVSREKDKFMNESYFINHGNLIYLFKLK